MELILNTDDEAVIAKIINFAEGLHVSVERRELLVSETEEREKLRNWLINFKPTGPSSIEDPVAWQREQREDRDLPFRS